MLKIKMVNEILLDEYNSVKKNVGLLDFSIEGKIKVKGKDRVDFINGLVSNDIKNLKENSGVYAAFLDKFGKILSDCVVYKFKDFILINLSLVGKANIIGKLKELAKFNDCEIEDISLKYGLISLQGPKSFKLINTIVENKIDLISEYDCIIKIIKIKKTIKKENNKENKHDNNINEENGLKINNEKNNENFEIFISKNNRTTEEGYDIFIPFDAYKEFKNLVLEKGNEYGLDIINNDVYNILRLEAKIPLFGIDFNSKNILPEVSEKAISYEKGCYLGQEIVARIKSLAKGVTSKKLVSLEIESREVPEKNSKIFKDNGEIGYISSAGFSPGLNKVVGFGFINKGNYDQGNEVEIGEKKFKGIVFGF